MLQLAKDGQSPQLAWRQSWLESVGDAEPDLCAMEGMRGVYIASTVAESEVRPTYLTILITFDGVAE